MIRRIPLLWRDETIGTIQVPAFIRPPITQAELDGIPCALFVRSRSWLFDVRPGDVKLHLCVTERKDAVVAIASQRLGPGDIGCIIGFEASAARSDIRADEEIITIADEIMRQTAERRGA
ncbi:MAG: hypothetical protein CL949_19795 [Erythrobacter sp.]|nr:hypothetical protein [Erythrobacter sp.]